MDTVVEKVFKGVDSFHNYRHIYRSQRHLANLLEDQLDLKALPYKWNVNRQLQFGTPIYFVARSILDACIHTSLPQTIDLDTVPFPFRAASYVLPRGNGLKVHDKELARVEFCKQRIMHTDSIGGDYLFVFFFNENNLGAVCRLANPYGPTEDVITPNGNTKAETLVQLVFTITWAMQDRPEYLESGRRVSMHKKSGSEIWTPNIIGRKYATKRIAGAEIGAHTSPRMHWRRGHHRYQPFGIGRTETKVIWIEPTLVAALAKTA